MELKDLPSNLFGAGSSKWVEKAKSEFWRASIRLSFDWDQNIDFLVLGLFII